MKYIRVRYKKSSIGYNQRQKDTVKSLGLRKLGQSKTHRATPQVLGMCRHVQHLVEWEEVQPPSEGAGYEQTKTNQPGGPAAQK